MYSFSSVLEKCSVWKPYSNRKELVAQNGQVNAMMDRKMTFESQTIIVRELMLHMSTTGTMKKHKDDGL